MNLPIRIAVVGAGYMGQNHVKILSSIPDVNLVAVCDLDKEKTKKLARQYKIKEYSDFEELAQNEELDAVTICLPTTLHFQAASFFVSKKIPTLVEKPICSTTEEASRLASISSRNNTPVMVGHIERFNPVVNEIKLRINSNELGKIIMVHTQRFSPPSSQKDVSVVVDLATHDIDVIKYLMGEKFTRIFAETKKIHHKYIDFLSCLVNFKGGAAGLVEASWVHPVKIRNLTIVGEKGMYKANYLSQELLFYRQNEQLYKDNNNYSTVTRADIVKVAFQSKEPLYLELEAFTEALRIGKSMPITVQDGIFTLRTAELMIKSGKLKRALTP